MHIYTAGSMAFVQSAGFTLLSFALVISVVVFFHELGHLLVGKALGVRAIRFSIGFGPKLFGFKGRETEYRVSLLPLGGYVKFAGDNPYEEVAPEDRGRGFLEQPPWKKGLIAFAGPAANFILAIVLYFVVFAAPHQDLAARVGYVKPQSPAAQAGLRYGDRILAIDGEPVEGWSALQEKVRAHAGQPLAMEIERGGQRLTLRVVPAVHEETDAVETVKHGRIGISPAPRAAEATVVSPDSPAGRAGLQTFDKVAKLDGAPVPNWEDLEEKLAARTNEAADGVQCRGRGRCHRSAYWRACRHLAGRSCKSIPLMFHGMSPSDCYERRLSHATAVRRFTKRLPRRTARPTN